MTAFTEILPLGGMILAPHWIVALNKVGGVTHFRRNPSQLLLTALDHGRQHLLVSLRGLSAGFGRRRAAVWQSSCREGRARLHLGVTARSQRAEGWRRGAGRAQEKARQPGAGRRAVLSVILRKSRIRIGFPARLRVAPATASSRPLMSLMARHRRRVVISAPWPERIRLRSSSRPSRGCGASPRPSGARD